MLKIAIAKTPEQIDATLKLRHRIWVKNNADAVDNATGAKEQRLMDHFDAFPSTTHLVAIERNRVIGSLRLTVSEQSQQTGVGVPTEIADALSQARQSVHDYLSPHGTLLSCDFHCVEEGVSAQQATVGLLLMASYVALSKRASHIVAAVKSEMVQHLESAGFREFKQTTTEEKADNSAKQSTTTLITLNVQKDLKDSFVQFSEENELEDLMHAYGCTLYQPGESILRAGTAGNCAFVITAGEVDVRHPGSRVAVDTMGVGEVFGELALLTDQVRSADIIARTEVRTMVLEKSIFVEHLMADPKAALKLLTSMGHRMKHLIDYCNTLAA